MTRHLHRSLAALSAATLACAAAVVGAAPASAADADLGVTYTIAPTSISADETAALRVVVANSGAVSAGYSMTITHSGPVDSVAGPPAGCTTLGSSITCTGNLFPGGQTAREFVITPSGTGTITSTAVVTITGANADPNPGNNVASTQIAVVGTDADLAVGLDATATALGSRITYDLTAHNQGPGAVDGATLVVDLPTQVTQVTGLPGGCDYNPTTDHVTCATGPIAAGAQFDATFRATVALLSTGQLPATASRTASNPTDPNAANDTASATCNVLTSLVIACPN